MFYYMYFVALLVLTTSPQVARSAPSQTQTLKPIVRQNYGVIFRHRGQIDDSHSYFKQQFIIPQIKLPRDFSRPLKCPLARDFDQGNIDIDELLHDLPSMPSGNNSVRLTPKQRQESERLCDIFKSTYKSYYEGRDQLI